VPFTELFFNLAEPNGYVGMITSNAFMKRSTGKKLIEQFLTNRDLTHVLDTSGVYLPGHGTPTAVLVGRNRPPLAAPIRVVRGIRGETAVPEDTSTAPVWLEIRDHTDEPGFNGRFVSISDAPRESFRHHPWSTGGGGAAELKERLDEAGAGTLRVETVSLGKCSWPGLDDVFIAHRSALLRRRLPRSLIRDYLVGSDSRDWFAIPEYSALLPYDENHELLTDSGGDLSFLREIWPWKTSARGVVSFEGRTQADLGKTWYAWYRHIGSKYQSSYSIVFGEVARRA